MGYPVNNVCTKTHKTIGFLRRNLNTRSSYIKKQAYKYLIRSSLASAYSAWDPYNKSQIYKLEVVKRRSAILYINLQKCTKVRMFQWKVHLVLIVLLFRVTDICLDENAFSILFPCCNFVDILLQIISGYHSHIYKCVTNTNRDRIVEFRPTGISFIEYRNKLGLKTDLW
jgi:hypothetical protein